jgi:hypothetical protein
MFWIFGRKKTINEFKKHYGARTIQQYYYNSKNIVELSYGQNSDPHDRLENANSWCKRNCSGLYDSCWQRGWFNSNGEFEINGIGGFDHIFFAFEKSQDAIMFKLRWG